MSLVYQSKKDLRRSLFRYKFYGSAFVRNQTFDDGLDFNISELTAIFDDKARQNDSRQA
jgi:hypothetical protein